MRNNPDSFSTTQKSATSNEVADSHEENRDRPSSDQSNLSEKEESNQRKNQEKKTYDFDADLKIEMESLDQECESILNEDEFINEDNLKSFMSDHFPNDQRVFEMAEKYIQTQNTFGASVTSEKLENYLIENKSEKEELSTADQVREYTESIRRGKSSEFILRSLISKFGNDPDIGTWVENWQKFLRLHELAKGKSPRERKAIQSIITRADFTDENAFSVSLSAIQSSSELSQATKLEIFTEFDGAAVTTVNEMDSGLKLLHTRKQKAREMFDTKVRQLDKLESDIERLKEELNKLPESSSKRDELRRKIDENSNLLKKTKDQVTILEIEKKKETSFEIRKNFRAKMNQDGSRSIQSENFVLQLPSNVLPFTGMKNLRSLNLAFVCDPLKRLGIMNEVFSPNLDSGAIPSKTHRDTGHAILESLGIKDKEILSVEGIRTLNRDLSRITYSGVLSPREHLIELGLYSVTEQSFDMIRFLEVLKFSRENREISQDKFSKKLIANLERKKALQ